MKAEEAARESRHTKQDRYAEMRRRKDEEHEAKERMLVGLYHLLVHIFSTKCVKIGWSDGLGNWSKQEIVVWFETNQVGLA